MFSTRRGTDPIDNVMVRACTPTPAPAPREVLPEVLPQTGFRAATAARHAVLTRRRR